MILPLKKMNLAILTCSYNRIGKTTAFLNSLVNQKLPEHIKTDIYLLDDNSPDGTAAHIETAFPEVHLVKGSGSLFWAGGMRTIWKYVLSQKEYDFFLLCNDDVVLMDGAIGRLLDAHQQSDYTDGNIVLGTVIDSEGCISYGGQKIVNRISGNSANISPDKEKLTPCEIGNANVMLVDKQTVNRIGILPEFYTHGIADYDYTLTAVANGVKLWIGPGYYGFCDNDHSITWLPQSAPLRKRIEYLYSPKGLAYDEHMVYVKRHFPLSAPITRVKLWAKTLLPIVYDVFKKEGKIRA
jgi:GT2 family glycosyltransferase